MGRPPIGKTAMTGAERTRLYRLKHGTAKPVTKPVTKPAGADHAALVKELERATARFRELQARCRDLEARIVEAKASKGAIDPATFSMTAQQKMDAWKRQQMRAMAREFDQRVLVESRRLLDESLLPTYRERLEYTERQIKAIDKALDRRSPLISKAMYRIILACLHPDSRKGATEEMFTKAFVAFSNKGDRDKVNKIEIALCGKEADRPKGPPLPTWAEMMAGRAAYDAKNRERAKRAAATRAARKEQNG